MKSNDSQGNNEPNESIIAEETKSNKGLKLAINIIPLALFIGLLVFLWVRFGHELTELASKPEKLREVLNSYGWSGILVFIGIQIIQVVVAAIPGEFVQIAGGYIYGTVFGTLYSLTGIVAGSVIVFFSARILGYPVVKLLVPQRQLERFSFMLNSRKSDAAMLILFLIPGIPKDILTYIAGITPVKPLKFFVIITIGRLPALLGSSFIGHNTQMGNYGIVIAVSAAAVILFFAGVIFRNRIIDWTHKLIKKDKMPEQGSK